MDNHTRVQDERSRIETAALLIRNAQATRIPIAHVRSSLPANDIEAAYRVQELNVAAALAAGRRLVGRKIGLTSTAVQAQLGVDRPDFGVLFANMEVEDSATIADDRLIQPKIEAEIAFVLARDLTNVDPTFADVAAAIDFALPAIEIVDSRIAGWDIGIVDTIADNASSGLFVVGTRPRRLADIDLELCGMVMEANGAIVGTGVGAACLGHPLNAVRWLAATAAQHGRPLRAGHLILSGALGAMVTPKPGVRYRARIGGVGDVSVAF